MIFNNITRFVKNSEKLLAILDNFVGKNDANIKKLK